MVIERSKNPQDFVVFERAGWDEHIVGYDHAFGPVSRQTVRPTLDAARVSAGMRVLDVCTGPGMLAEAALQRGAIAVGLDFSAEVVDFARRRVPTAEFRRGDAQDLPFPNDSFDAVVCGYGIMHIPEPDLALREMLRVVRPGGRVALSVWDGSTPSSIFALIYAAVRAHGTIDVSLPHGPDFFQFGTLEKMQAALVEVGLIQVEAEAFAPIWHLDDASQAIDIILMGTVRASALLAAQSDTAATAIRHFLEEALNEFSNASGGLEVPLPVVIGNGANFRTGAFRVRGLATVEVGHGHREVAGQHRTAAVRHDVSRQCH
jgi:SAM-dependent methyltransferase